MSSSKKHYRHAKSHHMPFRHQIALFFVYLVLFLAIFGMIDYYAYDILNPMIFMGMSFIAALWATVIHMRHHIKTKVNKIAREIEEIL